MKREKLVELARNLGINEKFYASPIKSLVWSIQEAQGMTPCYLNDERYDCNRHCEWSCSCKKLTSAWLR